MVGNLINKYVGFLLIHIIFLLFQILFVFLFYEVYTEEEIKIDNICIIGNNVINLRVNNIVTTLQNEINFREGTCEYDLEIVTKDDLKNICFDVITMIHNKKIIDKISKI